MNTSESISLLDFSLALSETLDIASPLLAQHQLRTAYVALRIGTALKLSSSSALIAKNMGYSDCDCEMMLFAGNMHDVGKLSVPNSILEKPAQLTSLEFAVVRQHTYHTCLFMNRCGLPSPLVEWAGYHHEKINGNGYPYHKRGGEISEGSRIIAVADVLTALAEDRPYRKGMRREEVIAVLRNMVMDEHLDAGVVRVVEKCYNEIVEPTLYKQIEAKEQFAAEMEMMSAI